MTKAHGTRQVADHTTPAHSAAIVASSADAITGYGVDGAILHWNPAAERLYQVAASEAVGHVVWNVLPSEAAERVAELLERVARGQGVGHQETTWRLPDGSRVELSLSVSPITDDRGGVIGVSVAARDITTRKHAESLLSGVSSILEMIAGAAPLKASLDALAELIERHARTARCAILVVTDEGLRHGGGLDVPGVEDVPVEDLVASPLGDPHAVAAIVVSDLASDRRWEAGRDTALRLGLRTCWSSPIVRPGTQCLLGVFALYYEGIYRPDDEDWGLLARLTHVAALAIGRDRIIQQLEHQAIHDPLTGAANRTLVADRLGHALARLERERTPMALLFLDLDRFKALNDRYGHDAGDTVLVEVTKRLRSAVRPSDTVARLGGDEFVVLCERVTGELEAVGIADRIAEAVGAPFLVDETEVQLTASIGIAFPRGGETPGSLLEQADAAMYQAKHGGKAHFRLFDTAMHHRALERLETEKALCGALAGNQLRLVYQPIVDLQRGTIVAMEALVRWEHPERGLLGPSQFLAIAEGTGLMVPIDTWVLHEACRQAAERHNERGRGRQMRMHVNVSGHQLGDPSFPVVVQNALASSGVEPSSVVLEVAETVVMQDPSVTMRVFRALKPLGVRLSIDDFGTGHTSLPCLSSLPLDELKIDRTLIAAVSKNAEGPAVLAIVRLAGALGLEIVAEGVERAEQAEQLRRIGCGAAQGFYWSRPVAVAEL